MLPTHTRLEECVLLDLWLAQGSTNFCLNADGLTGGTSPVSAPDVGGSSEAPDRGTFWPESRAKSHFDRSCRRYKEHHQQSVECVVLAGARSIPVFLRRKIGRWTR